ncbi:MAG: phosphatase PAP2 family protein, partial [Spirochaetales bacterium]|nr:phosphatase PAP2 family protein [Spirochaetales bacterium]
ILIAFSRLYLYVHFPSDVFAGMILGIVFSIICYVASGKFCRIEKTFNKED